MLYLKEFGVFVNLTGNSNGWFRFMTSPSRHQRFCWSDGIYNDQDLPPGIHVTVSSLEHGSGDVLSAAWSFGLWKVEAQDQLLTVSNSNKPGQQLVLGSTGFFFLGACSAVVNENGEERICSIDECREALKAAAAAAAERPKSSVTSKPPTIGQISARRRARRTLVTGGPGPRCPRRWRRCWPVWAWRRMRGRRRWRPC